MFQKRKGTRLQGLLEGGQWKCDCNPRLPASTFEVKKESASKGRWFYTCQKPADRCPFFLWKEDAERRAAGALAASHSNGHRSEPIPPPTTYKTNAEALRRSLAPQLTEYPEDTPSRSSKSFTTRYPSFDMTSEDERALQQAERNLAAPAAPAAAPTPAARHAFTTPGKRRYADMLGPATNGLPTPDTHNGNKRTWTARTAESSSHADELLDLVSPQTTPTPASRFRDVGSADGSLLWADMLEVLKSDGVEVGLSTRRQLESVCNAYARKGKGVLQAREILRKALHARESKVVELNQRIKTLEAELDMERDVIRYLRSGNKTDGESD